MIPRCSRAYRWSEADCRAVRVFFSCIGDSSLVYIFGVWPSLEAHLQFLDSPARDEVLGPQEEILDFQWTIHLDLKSISPLLLDAPFIVLQRLEINVGCVESYNKIIDEHVRTLQRAGRLNVTYGWRCDSPVGGSEAAILTSWAVEESGDTEVGSQIALNSNDDQSHRQILFHHGWNIEHYQHRGPVDRMQ
ncbi:hypothetical protein C7974DRAFT_129443 [Boeremia exigua]|uniref:uncharacterized protein n=1 Tax=Boeremia exigua TaxID=749465 RepID=UPI001E8EE989|nr:uncharacterized protein C7974DRAFT_129443 [Boeremia exigua]KAH6639348.1 hypothetical protein C7974DRAFT_129443 [Boeremia exigua]